MHGVKVDLFLNEECSPGCLGLLLSFRKKKDTNQRCASHIGELSVLAIERN